MLSHRLHLKLLAPTVLVSLALVGACLFGVLYLNGLHVDVSRVLEENVQSTQAATRLEATTEDIIRLLHSGAGSREGLAEQIRDQNEVARRRLEDVQNLANLDREKELVPRIGRGLGRYLQDWQARKDVPPDRRAAYDEGLARTLEEEVIAPCADLRRFNTGEVEKTERDNRLIVQRLTWVLLAVGLGAPLGGLLLGYGIARSLHHSIYQLSVRIRDAAGRLNRELASVTVEEESDLHALHGRMQQVMQEIERMVERLQQREREVLRAEQLAAVGQVAAGIAHELRNPLTSVKMLVQTGLEGAAPGLPAEDLGLMEREIRRMEQCIQTFLDLARPPRSERRRTDLAGVVRRSLLLVEGRAKRQRVAVSVDLPPEPVHLEIDPEQVHQVLVNLLLNALDAQPRGGRVNVAVARAKGPDGRAAVEVRVEDGGPGIVPRVRERLFEPFVSSKETGLGLGLSISKRLVEAHGGSIRGENARTGGALFAFTLPA
ncbi:MAG TPA: ATP-binding protein [Gemmataceae bacterium]|nr:ATP-binding protein [Gemmataceae bacterium]